MSRDSDNPLDWTFSVGHRKGQKMILVDDERGCWIWQGHLHAGYGVMTYNRKLYPWITVGRQAPKADRSKSEWRAIMPHQFFYCLKYGNPPEGTQLAHTCHRRSCCNPDHVTPKSHQENTDDKFMHPAMLTPDAREAVEHDLRDDQPIHQVAFNHCLPVYTVVHILTSLRSENLDLPFEDPVPF